MFVTIYKGTTEGHMLTRAANTCKIWSIFVYSTSFLWLIVSSGSVDCRMVYLFSKVQLPAPHELGLWIIALISQLLLSSVVFLPRVNAGISSRAPCITKSSDI